MGRIITRPDGRKFHLGGRIAPKTRYKLRMRNYNLNMTGWPATPVSTSYGKIASSQAVLTDILGNDVLGDCTEANSYHLQALRQGASGSAVYHPTLDQVIATYSRDGGYIVGDSSTDQGCDETVVLQNASSLGISASADDSVTDKIAGFVGVDATNTPLVRACVSMFVGGAVCMALPDEWVSPFPSAPGWTWDVPDGGYVGNPNNGHCYTLADQNEDNLQGFSWGMPFTLTYAALEAGAIEQNGGDLYFLIDQDILDAASKLAPNGLDWAALQADFTALSC